MIWGVCVREYTIVSIYWEWSRFMFDSFVDDVKISVSLMLRLRQRANIRTGRLLNKCHWISLLFYTIWKYGFTFDTIILD
jgi:predicted DNA-binding protein (MmcQ/YjbR family)